jgi:hypothetical protein
MTRLWRLGLTLAIAVASLAGSIARAEADPLTISIADLDALRLFGTTPGSNVTLFGTVTNNSLSPLFLNGSGGASNDNDPPDTNIVLFPFFYIGNAPGQDPFVLAPGQSTGLTRLVTVSINPSAPVPSLTSGSVEICGGADAQACELLGRAFYSIRVADTPPAPTPEPASIILLASGLAGTVMRVRRDRRRPNGQNPAQAFRGKAI